jgi:hypothetical protein
MEVIFMRWAIINNDTNLVENIIIWDGVTSLYPYDTSNFVQLQENEPCSMGWLYQSSNNPRFTEVQPEEV